MNSEKIKQTIEDYSKLLKDFENKNVVISYSGGRDSDMLLKLTSELKPDIKGIFFNTGLEYEATKRQVNKRIEEGV